MKKIYIFLLIVLLFVCITVYVVVYRSDDEEDETPVVSINSFEECIAAGYPAMESYPRQCKTPDGKSFTEYIGNELEKIDLIRIDSPRPNQEIESPLIIEGEARGYWFFEGDFPVVLTDWDGLIIAQAIAQAKGEWMTKEFVQFEARLEFEKPEHSNRGTLILQKDNPSGLPENDDALEIPVIFKPALTSEPEEKSKEEACISSGGEVTASLCCKSSSDYPNLCLIGPCGCSPDNSHQVKICDCDSDKCFNGKKCVSIDQNRF